MIQNLLNKIHFFRVILAHKAKGIRGFLDLEIKSKVICSYSNSTINNPQNVGVEKVDLCASLPLENVVRNKMMIAFGFDLVEALESELHAQFEKQNLPLIWSLVYLHQISHFDVLGVERHVHLKLF